MKAFLTSLSIYSIQQCCKRGRPAVLYKHHLDDLLFCFLSPITLTLPKTLDWKSHGVEPLPLSNRRQQLAHDQPPPLPEILTSNLP